MLSLLFMFIAGFANAIMDVLQFRFNRSIFKNYKALFWNPNVSWRNKWKDGDHTKGERFWLSSSFLVFTTDAWHLFQSLMLWAFTLSVIFYQSIVSIPDMPILSTCIDFILLRGFFGLSFVLFFKKVLISSEKTN